MAVAACTILVVDADGHAPVCAPDGVAVRRVTSFGQALSTLHDAAESFAAIVLRLPVEPSAMLAMLRMSAPSPIVFVAGSAPPELCGEEAGRLFSVAAGTAGEQELLRALLYMPAATDGRDADRRLVRERERFHAALDNIPHGICLFDDALCLLLCNSAYAAMYGLPAEMTAPGMPLRDILSYRASLENAPIDVEDYLEVIAASRREHENPLFRTRLMDGRTIEIRHNNIPGGGYVALHQDVTEQVRAAAQIRHMAGHDALTGLPNRTLLRERLDEALRRVRRGRQLAVLSLDLDHFKAVNGALGHKAGDRLLQRVTDRLKASIGETDMVARLGADEFLVAQFDIASPQEASALARRIIEDISQPYDLNGDQAIIGASVGIALAPGDGVAAEALLKHAGMALHRAKADARGSYHFFEPAMDARVSARRQMEIDLHRAIRAREFEVHYQPVVDAATLAITGCEALLRWTHPERGPVGPGEFIPVAEECGLIVPIGEWVLRTACVEAATWPAGIKLAVNLSAVQFRSASLLQAVTSALALSGLAAYRLELEITETVLLNHNEATLSMLHHLRSLGVRIAMDDFGTGYSSLSYLRSFPFDRIKIDRSFVREVGETTDSLAIVKAVADLAASLGMHTTAEGVETEQQFQRVRDQGCTEIQGYYFSPPRPADAIARMLSPSLAAIA